MELKHAEVPNGTWKVKENRIQAIKWLIDKVQWSHDEVIEQLDKTVFTKYGLCELLDAHYSRSVVKALQEAFPDEYFPWEFGRVPDNTWDIETGIKATRWLLAKKLKFSSEEITKNSSHELFSSYGLKGMIDKLYKGSASMAVGDAFGDSIRVWELPVTPKGYWNSNTAADCVRWLITKN